MAGGGGSPHAPLADRLGRDIQREAIEVKLYRDRGTEAEGLEQLGRYLTRIGEPAGHLLIFLLIFDRREGRSWEERIFRREGVALG